MAKAPSVAMAETLSHNQDRRNEQKARDRVAAVAATMSVIPLWFQDRGETQFCFETWVLAVVCSLPFTAHNLRSRIRLYNIWRLSAVQKAVLAAHLHD